MRWAYGGVVVDVQGRVLLREARKHKFGDVWTFPKGGPNPGEANREAALREVFEETGWSATIYERIPGEFKGTMGMNIYYVMRAGKPICEPKDESQATRWVSPDEAPALLKMSESSTVVKRELDVLAAAIPIIQRMLAGAEPRAD
jgi:8-oxo-dGTP diphosphatase